MSDQASELDSNASLETELILYSGGRHRVNNAKLDLASAAVSPAASSASRTVLAGPDASRPGLPPALPSISTVVVRAHCDFRRNTALLHTTSPAWGDHGLAS